MGGRPRCCSRDFLFGFGPWADAVDVDAVAAVEVAANDTAAVVDDAAGDVVAACGFRRHDGYPDADQAVAFFSAAAVLAADVAVVDTAAADVRGPGVDDALGGARTTTDEIPDFFSLPSIFFFSFSALLSIASLRFLSLLSPGLSPLLIASFLA